MAVSVTKSASRLRDKEFVQSIRDYREWSDRFPGSGHVELYRGPLFAYRHGDGRPYGGTPLVCVK